MTFRQYLKQQRHRDDPVGDIARDVEQDTDHAQDAGLLTAAAAMRRHIVQHHNPCPAALEAFDQARQEWQAANGGRP